jgi:hypothetical protein
MMAWMSDRFANSSKEIERPGLRGREPEGYLSNKQDEKDFPKGASHLLWRILPYFEQSFNRYDSITIMSMSTSMNSSFACRAVA